MRRFVQPMLLGGMLVIGIILGAGVYYMTRGGAGELVGEWIQTQGSNPSTRLIFREDGTGRLEVHQGINFRMDSWDVDSGRIIMSIYDQEVTARYLLSKDLLEVSRVEGYEDMNGTYQRY
ncbi:MAG: hypothetical protein R3200_11000 [Xanthomonadales bacterium]|nr:hypothetical protein [Xanthomonadales bacterium]